MQHLFVYGSLMFPEIVKGITSADFETTCANLKGYRRHKLKNRDYPAIVEETGMNVTGKLLKNVDEKSFAKIMYFEGDEYVPKTVDVLVENRTIKATVFVWNNDKKILLEKDWSINEFKNESLNFYVDEILPLTRSEFFRKSGKL